MSMKEAEQILKSLGVCHGPLSEWVLRGEGGFNVYYTRVEVFRYELWCYVQIWGYISPPDVWLFTYPLHADLAVMPNRDWLYEKSVCYWVNYRGGPSTLTEECLTELMIREVLG